MALPSQLHMEVQQVLTVVMELQLMVRNMGMHQGVLQLDPMVVMVGSHMDHLMGTMLLQVTIVSNGVCKDCNLHSHVDGKKKQTVLDVRELQVAPASPSCYFFFFLGFVISHSLFS